eukprot:GEZU01013704.1.p1 GENE.GEZU01013704.1~~GEZU01013704.1.p1  ORF type:complete len:246 (-),score=47.14 GEZU01013704.1:158-895(-)
MAFRQLQMQMMMNQNLQQQGGQQQHTIPPMFPTFMNPFMFYPQGAVPASTGAPSGSAPTTTTAPPPAGFNPMMMNMPGMPPMAPPMPPQQQQQQQSSNKKRRAAYEPPEGAATKLSFQHALPQNRVFVNEAQNYYFASHNSKNCEEHKQPAAPQFQRPILLAPGASCPTPFSIEVLNVAELERQLSATTAQGLIPDFDIADFLANCIVNNDADTSSSTASAGISDSTDIFGASTTVFPLKLALQM